MPDPTNSAPLRVGVDLGGTNIQTGVVDADAEIIGRDKRKTDADSGYQGVLARIVASVKAACEDAGLGLPDIVGVGVGAPGPVEPEQGVVVTAVNLRWDEAPLARDLAAALGRPVSVGNDADVALYGEWKHGAARGATDALGVWVGTGIGGALVLAGRPYRGAFNTAGEIGHVHFRPFNPPGMRSLEHNCSRTAVVDRVRHLIRANRETVITELIGGKSQKIKSRHLAEAYRKGDALVCEIIDETAESLGIAVGGIVTLLSLECVVIGGGLTEALGEPYVARIRGAIRKIAFPNVCKGVRVVESALGDDAGIVGAAELVAAGAQHGE